MGGTWIVPILIDGHNLIGRLAMLSLQDADDEEKLVRLLRSYQARTGKAITVVFDPGDQFALSRSVRFGAMEIRFAPHGSSADAVIVRRVRSSRDPQGWLVITSDQELAETVMQQGARVQSAEAFALELEPHEPSDWKDAPLSPEEVEAWLGLFEGQD
jgi:predicted RNA-binding protein with PIN domain